MHKEDGNLQAFLFNQACPTQTKMGILLLRQRKFYVLGTIFAVITIQIIFLLDTAGLKFKEMGI